jgi:WD40 repeat protein
VNAHQGEVTSVKFVDANMLATCGSDGLIRIWNLSRFPIRTFELDDPYLRGVKVSPDGSQLLYFGQSEFVIADADSGEFVLRRSEPDVLYRGRPVWSLTGEKMAICYDHIAAVAILDKNGQLLRSISHDGVPAAVAFSPNGSLLAVVGDRHLQVCNIDNGRNVFKQSLSSLGFSVTFSHDGRRLAFGAESGAIGVVSVPVMRPVHELASGSEVECLAFSANGSLLATGHGDSIVRIWEASTGQLQSKLVGHERAVDGLAFSPDERTLISASTDGTVRLWSVDLGRSYGVLHRPEKPSQCRFNFSPNGRHLVLSYRDSHVVPRVLLWHLEPAAGQ